jgi:hypothetical protein
VTWGETLAGTIRRSPALHAAARRTRRWLWNTRIRLRRLRSPSADTVLLVDPASIRLALVPEMPVYRDAGLVLDGDWDLGAHLEPFDDKDACVAIRERFLEGRPWRETAYWRRLAGEIAAGRIRPGCASEAELDARLARLDRLWDAIRTHGFRSAAELHPGARGPRREDDVAVVIGRHGDLIFNNGRHRLAMAKLLRLPRVPVRVTARHAAWVRFRRELTGFVRRQRAGAAYHPLAHPDLADLPSVWTDRRLEIIRPHLPAARGRLLDLGAHLGFFSQRLAEEGFECDAVESDRAVLGLLRPLCRAGGSRYTVVEASALDLPLDRPYDVVLALSLFHHFIKSREAHEAFLAMLGRLETPLLFFQPHDPVEGQMAGAYRNYAPEEFAELIRARARLDRIERIGEERGRAVYKIERAAGSG